MSENVTHLVFSYGTLKRSERNHEVLAAQEKGTYRFLGSGETVSKYPLVVGTKFYIPFMIDLENKGHNVKGEIFEVDDTMLAFLDEFEGHPHMYNRQEISISMAADKDDKPLETVVCHKCWVYFLSKVDETDMLEKKWMAEFKEEEGSRQSHPPLAERMKRKAEIEKELFHANQSPSV